MKQTDLLDLLADDRLLELLALIAGDPMHAEDRSKVVAAILADADEHGGEVDPNRVREALTNEHGLTVYPRVLSATYSALRATGAIERAGVGVNADRRGKNAGKWIHLYRLADRRAAA